MIIRHPRARAIASGAPALIDDYDTSSDDDAPLTATMGFELAAASDSVFKAVIKIKNSSTAGNVTLRIETDSGTEPSGMLADANATKLVYVDEANFAWIEFEFPAQFSLAGSTQYWLVASTAGAHRWDGHRNAISPNDLGAEWGGSWQFYGSGFFFRVYDMSG